MGDSVTPLVLRRRLRTELRNARQERDLTQEQVAKAMYWSLSKMVRIEKAQSSISVNDLKALLLYYKITDEERTAELVDLAEAARKQSWWSSYSNVAPKTLLELIDYESAASSVRQFEPMFVPGILQTREYARAVLQNYYVTRPESELTALVELRTKREDLLNRDDAPKFSFILDEPVIHRVAGGPSVMRRQLDRLVEVAKSPHVTIRVVPYSAGIHPGTRPFEIIQFVDAADEFALFLENPRGDDINDDPEETENYRERFERIEDKSLKPADSLAFINDVAAGMT
jgi:transcriptional regulator with XRE-family HTH domain